jgi:hypothetical protein
MSERQRYLPNIWNEEEYPQHFVFTHRGRVLNEGDVVGYTREIDSVYEDRKTPIQKLIWTQGQVIGVSYDREKK